ncbi:hypothetical protein EVAR_7369_1 [Eumeta japonica]|uniref:Uncharacterized protein n=1 Tax=Eumeta variegata TaxID=151549 RepID=A0A4C1V646_EUMVA|nr:hypothetical protein EVAR_7369_1 [Eumeta japonica]
MPSAWYRRDEDQNREPASGTKFKTRPGSRPSVATKLDAIVRDKRTCEPLEYGRSALFVNTAHSKKVGGALPAFWKRVGPYLEDPLVVLARKHQYDSRKPAIEMLMMVFPARGTTTDISGGIEVTRLPELPLNVIAAVTTCDTWAVRVRPSPPASVLN